MFGLVYEKNLWSDKHTLEDEYFDGHIGGGALNNLNEIYTGVLVFFSSTL